MNPKLMQQALQKRKAKGLDITILLGMPEGMEDESAPDSEDEESKELDLAPSATEIGDADEERDEALGKMGHMGNEVPGEEIINHPDSPEDKELIRQELAKIGLGRGSLLSRAKKA